MPAYFGCKRLFLTILPLSLAACDAPEYDRVALRSMNAASTSEALNVVSQNADSIGAAAKKVGNEAVVVTYRGGPRGYFACTTKGTVVAFQKGSTLDARTRVVADQRALDLETVYIATASGADGPVSLAFSNTKRGVLPDGGYCRSTEALEGGLVAPR